MQYTFVDSSVDPSEASSEARARAHSARRLAVEHAVIDALSSGRDLPEVAEPVLRAICEGGGWFYGACWIADSDGQSLVHGRSWSRDPAATAAFVQASFQVLADDAAVGLVRRVWKTGQPTWVSDVLADVDYRRKASARAAGLHSAFAFPVTCAGRVLGVIEIYSQEIEVLDPRWLDCMCYVGSQVGQFHVRSMMQVRLHDSEQRFADTIERAAIGIAHVDVQGYLTHVNPWFCKLLGYRSEDLIGMTVRQISHPDDGAIVDEVRAKLWSGEIESFQRDKRYLRRDGSSVWVQLTVSVKRDDHGHVLYDIAIIQDISARKAAEAALHRGDQRWRDLLELSSDWHWEVDAEYRFASFGGRGRGHGGKSRREVGLVGRRMWEVPGADGSPRWLEFRAKLDRHEAIRDFEYSFVDGRRVERHVNVSAEPILGADGTFCGYRGVSRDVTARRVAERRIEYLATHDSLTGLANRVTFTELLGHVLRHARRDARRFAVVFVDLDRFKLVNDSLGHDVGDALLREVARRLKEGLRSSDVVARQGGDEFVILLQDLRGDDDAAHVLRKLLTDLARPVEAMAHEIRVTASLGIAVYPQHGDDEATLMARADAAMYQAKESGKNTFHFYDPKHEARTHQRLALESRLRHAVERGEFALHYQAKVDVADNTITGVEALLRWTNEELGSVSPAQFIPLAEETGLILSIGRWVLRTACAQAVAWQEEGLPPVRVAVNLSPRQLGDPDLVAEVRGVLADSGLDPHLLELEVTESSVMHDVERALGVLRALEDMGVRLAIDDFGTGYSSLAQLKRLPIDTIKVDRSFIRELPDDTEDRAITKAVIAMAKALKLTVVAEGVETLEQQAFLREHACDQMQGYLFSRPVPPQDFARLLRERMGGGVSTTMPTNPLTTTPKAALPTAASA